MPKQGQPAQSRWLVRGLVVSFIASLGGLGYTLLVAVQAVRSGRGLDTYRTHWLVEDNWIGFLSFFAAAVLALAIGIWLRYREQRQWRQLEQKYGQTKSDASQETPSK